MRLRHLDVLFGPAAQCPLLRRFYSMIDRHENFYQTFSALTPTYSATKAAIHAYSESMRYQLQGSSVEVLELVPPYVQTELMGGAEDPRAMPLAEFVEEAVGILTTQPDAREINVQRVHPLRFAERNGAYDATFKGLNDAMAGGH